MQKGVLLCDWKIKRGKNNAECVTCRQCVLYRVDHSAKCRSCCESMQLKKARRRLYIFIHFLVVCRCLFIHTHNNKRDLATASQQGERTTSQQSFPNQIEKRRGM
jgi:hypothetical protein